MAAVTWVVTGQDPDQYDFTNPANPALGVIIRFQTGDGNTGSIFLANTHYTVANARKAVEARAQIVDEIGRLSSGM